MSLNRSDIVSEIAQRAQLTKSQADAALSAFQQVLVDSLAKGEAVKLTGYFAAERTEHAAREVANPRNREEKIHVPAGYGVRIKVGSVLKKAVGKK